MAPRRKMGWVVNSGDVLYTWPGGLGLSTQMCYVLARSEANDLALRLAKSYTKRQDIMVVDRSYHGNLESLMDISPVKFKRKTSEKKDWVHVVPCPDVYRGMFREDTPDVGLRYANEALHVLQKAHEKGRPVAAFISEPALSLCGVIIPPANYLRTVYRAVREAGGLCIADEVQVGLGRTGEHFWAFQSQDVIPDIVTVGKPLGNGHPMAVVVTTKEIADSLDDFSSTFGGNPVACAVGLAVLDVIKNEKLMSSAMSVGKCLMEGFRAILPSHPMMGDVRGMGMLVGIEIVKDKISRKPAKEAAEILAYKMKEEKIIVAYEGPERNVIFLTPPMCFTCDNARRLVQTFHRVLETIERGALSAGLTTLEPGHKPVDEPLDVPIHVLSEVEETPLCMEEDDSEDGQPRSKHARYEEMD
ncbi:5-phosphohydroxy-L-lysine phospho-lyase-like [Liolophura sinensis]|uniref:5-phosphohydroxy-L-lysine phospho-lyase-like n=1 Tax=Liolophura sinensis TaxID=3198878 RepID=UPI003158238E